MRSTDIQKQLDAADSERDPVKRKQILTQVANTLTTLYVNLPFAYISTAWGVAPNIKSIQTINGFAYLSDTYDTAVAK